VKVRLFFDGHEVRSGTAMLNVVSCDGGPTLPSMALEWGSGNGRWSTHLDTSHLAPGCYRVFARIGDAIAGSFRLQIEGSTVAASSAALAADRGNGTGKGRNLDAPDKGGSKKDGESEKDRGSKKDS
jgi:hypothetical protein